MRTSLNRERRSENRLPDQEEEEVVVMEAVEEDVAVAERSGSPGRFKELDARVELG